MGADLYIKSIYHYDDEKHDFVGDESLGYFRDSYNASSVLWRLDLSWWQDIGERLDENGDLQSDGVRWLRDTVAATSLQLPTREELIADGVHVDDGESSVDKWHDYYRQKKERLLAFLDKALELNEPIHCSI